MGTENTWLTGIHYGLGAIRHQSIINCLGNRCFSLPVTTVEAGDKNDIESAAAINFSIGGKNYTKAAMADLNVVNADSYADNPVQAADTVCYYAFCVSAAGAVTSYKGKDDAGINGLGHPADLCCFCLVKVTTVAVTFELGTTDYDASGVTTVFTDVSFLPATI